MHLYKREELGKIKVVRKKDNAIRPEENNRWKQTDSHR
jgi:hypothetical protein